MSETDAEILNLTQQLASSGFHHTSRVGGANPELGMMMAKYNAEQLRRSLHSYRNILDELIAYIEWENWGELALFFTSTQQAKPGFMSTS